MSATPGISSPRLLVLMAIGIAVNIGLGQIVSTLSLPVFLDSLGTMVVALMAGPLAGLATGLVTNLVWGLVASPAAAGLLARWGMFRGPVQAAISGAIIAVALAFVAVPIRVWMFGGVTGSGADFLTGWLVQSGRDLFSSTLITVVTSNLVDKIVTALIAWGVVRGLPARTASEWPFLRHSWP